jgi:hypothetical protein
MLHGKIVYPSLIGGVFNTFMLDLFVHCALDMFSIHDDSLFNLSASTEECVCMCVCISLCVVVANFNYNFVYFSVHVCQFFLNKF